MYSDIEFITTQGVASVKTLADLADKVNKPGNIADPLTIGNIEGAIKRADDQIDSFLRAVFSGTLPLADPPVVLRSASAEIAVYLLWQSTSCPEEENPLGARNKYWLRWLEDLAKGIVVLDLGAGGETNTSFNAHNPRQYSDRKFSPETLGGRF